MAELNVSRESVSQFLSKAKSRFVIPEYQRPYRWDYEKCDTLWTDITSFSADRGENEDYFLGSVVTYKRSDGNSSAIEIIDGQQRVTTLLLLLRAIYKKLESMPEDDDVRGLKMKVAPCIWKVDSVSGKVKDPSDINIQSLVATESDNEAFHAILKTGKAIGKKDAYSQNYGDFQDKLDAYARDNPMRWYQLCVVILEYCIIFPIECGQMDTALTIFSTLNDRGMPLADSDIFKAQIYRSQSSEKARSDFSQEWRELSETVTDASITLDDLFRYYSHFIRASSSIKAKEIALRKFYLEKGKGRLESAKLMEDLALLADFWLNLNTRGQSLSNGLAISVESRKLIHCLEYYPNEFWKYITSVFFFVHRNDKEFETLFHRFLKTVVSFLLMRFIERPTVNAIKDDIYQACLDVFNRNDLKFSASFSDSFRTTMNVSYGSKIAPSLLLLFAYLQPDQDDLIGTFEIEHIFPRKWQSANYNGWSFEEAQEYLERFGNKVPIEKKLNIQAGNNYFGQKKGKYANSRITAVRNLANLPQNDWLKSDIEERDARFIETLISFFKESL